MTYIGILIGLIIRFAFYNNLNELNNTFSEDNKQVSSTIIWLAFLPILWFLLFPYVVTKIAVGLSFELQDRKIPTPNEAPTKVAGMIFFITGIIMELLAIIMLTADNGENVYFLLVAFALTNLVFFIIYWVKTNTYRKLLKKADDVVIEDASLNDLV